MGNFDPEVFLNATVEGEMSTKYSPIPIDEKDTYGPAFVDRVDLRGGESEKGPWVVLDVLWNIQDEELKKTLNRDKVTCRQSIFLDLSPSGAIASGTNQNVKLGKLREAVGQNGPEPWAPSMLVGAGPCEVRISHRPDKNDSDLVYDEVSAVRPL